MIRTECAGRARNRAVARVTALALFVALVGALASSGCKIHHSAHGYQDLPHVIRITSMPSGATLILPERGLSLITPADVELKLTRIEPVRVEKKGYETFEGVLGDVPQVARNTYRVDLVPR
jgi:hypothetical protein